MDEFIILHNERSMTHSVTVSDGTKVNLLD